MTDFTWRVCYGAQLTKQPKNNVATFGDGYSQRSAHGINNNPDNWSISCDSLDDATADAIMAFLDARGGVTSFTWTNLDGVTASYLCPQYDRTYQDEDKNAIKATFNRAYGG